MKVIGDKLVNNNGIPVELVFGDWEQINALNKHRALLESIENGIEVDIDVEERTSFQGTVEFTCICGNTNEIESGWDDDEPSNYDFVDRKIKCRCGINYKVTEEHGQLLIIKS